MSDVHMIHDTLKMNSDKSTLVHDADFGPSTFAGCPIYISQASYFGYALHTIDNRIANQRMSDANAFFSTMTPAERLDYMQKNRIGAVILKLESKDVATWFLPTASVDVIHGKDYTIFKTEDVDATTSGASTPSI